MDFSQDLIGKVNDLGLVKRISKDSAEYLRATVEYLMSELIDISVEVADSKKCSVVEPAHIRKAIDDDQDFLLFLRNVSIFDAGIKCRRRSSDEL